jgi:hypothetical protein
VDTKRCKTCEKTLPVDNFHRHPKGKYGVNNRCKSCVRDYQTEYASRPGIAEKKRAYSATWREENELTYKAKQKARYRANAAKRMWTSAKDSAVSREHVFDLRVEDIVVPDACPVFGTPFVCGEGRAHPDSASLDRIDSTKGYVAGNVWVISWRANRLKSDATLAELEALCAALRSKY